jgi:hypothetical protein
VQKEVGSLYFWCVLVSLDAPNSLEVARAVMANLANLNARESKLGNVPRTFVYDEDGDLDSEGELPIVEGPVIIKTRTTAPTGSWPASRASRSGPSITQGASCRGEASPTARLRLKRWTTCSATSSGSGASTGEEDRGREGEGARYDAEGGSNMTSGRRFCDWRSLFGYSTVLWSRRSPYGDLRVAYAGYKRV